MKRVVNFVEENKKSIFYRTGVKAVKCNSQKFIVANQLWSVWILTCIIGEDALKCGTLATY